MKIKRFLCVLMAAAFVLGAFALTASAEEKDASKDVTLTIYALEAADGSEVTVDASVTGEQMTLPDRKPIPDTGYTLYRVSDNETSTSVPDGEPAFETALTDAKGMVSVTIPASEQGRYLVVQNTKPDYAVGSTVPFLVDLPSTTPDGTGFMYSVFAYPKQELAPEEIPEESDIEPIMTDEDTDKELPLPSITKKVSEDAKTWGDEANIMSIIGNRAYWKVSVLVPETITRLNVFSVGDDLDKRLLPPDKGEVKASCAGKELAASAYTVKVEKQTITVDFKASELASFKNKTIDIIFPTYIDLKADKAVGEMIPNFATLTFTRLKGTPDTDGVDTDTETPGSDGKPEKTPVTTLKSPVVRVWTAEIEGFKHDESNKALSGADFELYSDKACKSKISAVTSDSKGVFRFVGVKDGTYYLKETKAPSGYKLNANVLEVKVKMKDNAVTKIDVANVKESTLPVTGGAGIIGISAAGLAIAAAGVLLILIALKLRKRELRAVA